jgi:hypothetical protein
MSTTMEGVLVAQETEVLAKARRRRFTAAEKLRVLRDADRCTKPADPRGKKLVEAGREIARLQARLERAEGLVAVQNKVS